MRIKKVFCSENSVIMAEKIAQKRTLVRTIFVIVSAILIVVGCKYHKENTVDFVGVSASVSKAPSLSSRDLFEDKESLKHSYAESRAKYILKEFGMSPENYTFAWNYELLDFVETDTYTHIRSIMDIQVGANTPSFYIGNDKIYCVFQDANAVNYMYTFIKNEDGIWCLQSNRQLQDDYPYPSFSNYQIHLEGG